MSSSNHPDPYRVRKSETLWLIAQTLYGRPSRWTEIASLNGITDPLQLRTGTALTVQADGLRSHPRRYTIQKNDTYIGIAAVHLGNSARWNEIACLNSVRPTALRTGMEVNVPLDFRFP
jgi:nucleoid-associated protein YgaU